MDIRSKISELLYWIAQHPYTEKFMEHRDSWVDWYDHFSWRRWSIIQLNRLSARISTGIMKMLQITCLLTKASIWVCIRLTLIMTMGISLYIFVLWKLDTYPPPKKHPSGDVVFYRDQCIIQGIQFPEYIEWCKSQELSHQPVVEIINW